MKMGTENTLVRGRVLGAWVRDAWYMYAHGHGALVHEYRMFVLQGKKPCQSFCTLGIHWYGIMGGWHMDWLAGWWTKQTEIFTAMALVCFCNVVW